MVNMIIDIAQPSSHLNVTVSVCLDMEAFWLQKLVAIFAHKLLLIFGGSVAGHDLGQIVLKVDVAKLPLSMAKYETRACLGHSVPIYDTLRYITSSLSELHCTIHMTL